jgi:hypothetical protein
MEEMIPYLGIVYCPQSYLVLHDKHGKVPSNSLNYLGCKAESDAPRIRPSGSMEHRKYPRKSPVRKKSRSEQDGQTTDRWKYATSCGAVSKLNGQEGECIYRPSNALAMAAR